MLAACLRSIAALYTLGPEFSNCHFVGGQLQGPEGTVPEVLLHPTLEDAVEQMPRDGSAALLACIAYPRLNEIIFSNAEWLELREVVVADTYPMVLASRTGCFPQTVLSHPAPMKLLPKNLKQVIATTSNSQAAIECASELADGCLTTSAAAEMHGLSIVRDFGRIKMGFSLHLVRANQEGR